MTHLLLVSDASKKGLQVVQTIHAVAKNLVHFEKAGLIVNRMPELSMQDRLSTGDIPLLSCIGDDKAMSMSDMLGSTVYSLEPTTEIYRKVETALFNLGILEGGNPK